MLGSWLFKVGIFLTILTVLAMLFGEYMAKVFNGERNLLSPVLLPLEKGIYKVCGIDPAAPMNWRTYAVYFLLFNLIGFIALFVLQMVQHLLPFNPQGFQAIRWDTALNMAISYVTNTNWQPIASETSASYCTHVLGFSLQNFLSAASGFAVAIPVIKAFVSKDTDNIGNFWVNLTRSLLYILLPLALVLSLALVSQGTVQNFNPYVKATTLEAREQIIPQGPAASQIAIKHLGTNGGGFFQANSAHPYENPNPLTDYLELLASMLIVAAFPFAFGAIINNRRQGWVIFTAMLLLYCLGLVVALWSESKGSPSLANWGVHDGANMLGKEVRHGILSSTFFAHTATATATGASNAVHASFMPMTSLVFIFNMLTGEVIFGGVGSGFTGMLLYMILAMFLIGLMIGHSPELFGKKLEPREMALTVTALFSPAILQLIFGAIILLHNAGNVFNYGSPHRITETIYTLASVISNNGSSMVHFNVDNGFYNLIFAGLMLIGRFVTLLPALAIAGSLVRKKFAPASARFPTTTPVFIIMLSMVVVILSALTFFSILLLGPALEHLSVMSYAVYEGPTIEGPD